MKVIEAKISNHLSLFKKEVKENTESSLTLKPNLIVVFKKTDYNKKHVSVKKHKDSRKILIFLKLEKLISKKELHKKSKVSLNLLAKKLDLSSGYLSQVINKVAGVNFSEYINSYRIEEVKQMLFSSEFDKYSILSLGYEAGFNSKSVFYTAFKKQTGLTPNQFKQQNRKDG